MDMKKSKKLIAAAAVFYWILVLVISAVANGQFRSTVIRSDALSPAAVVGEIVDGVTVTQAVTAPADQITGIELLFDTYGRSNTGTLHLTLSDETGNTLVSRDVDISTLENTQYTAFTFGEPVNTQPDAQLLLTVSSTGCSTGNAVTVYYGNSVNAGRLDLTKDIPVEQRYAIDGQKGLGKLCFRISSVDEHGIYMTYFWASACGIFLIAALLCLRWWKEAGQGKNNPLVAVCILYTRYSFLLKQLVSRDFKNKYKRSVLGMAWSFLNPLLTMCVQYLVFSTLFKSDTPNYPVYLLTGILFFNYLNEAVAQGMISITGNASLIKKVYIPKYLFPVSKTLSSLLNFLLSFVPLFLVIIFTGTRFHFSLLLLVFDVLCLVAFVTGLVLLMATAMTFFQDTQFLWSVFSMIWMYLTPVFYPESIIPARYLTVYHMNPMYQFITFARTCIIDGVSPEPAAYVKCLVCAGIMLLLGIFVFKKKQDQFVMNL